MKMINILMKVQKNIQELRNDFGTETQLLKSTTEVLRLDTAEDVKKEMEIREEEYKEAGEQREKRPSRNERIQREMCGPIQTEQYSYYRGIRERREKKG